MKSYVDNSLGRDEVVLYRARFPGFYSVGAFTLLTLSLVAAVFAYVNSEGILALAAGVGGVALFAIIMFPIWTTSITVTNQRFVYRRGLLSRATHDLQLRAVEEVNLNQGIFARLFDSGRLDIHGTGVDNIQLPLLADPLGLRQALQNGMAATATPITAAAE